MFRFLFVFLFFLTGCASLQERDIGPAKPLLTKEAAEKRFSQVKDVDYDLYFDLSKKEATYSGRSAISFNSKEMDGALRVDFHEGAVQSVTVNGQTIEAKHNGFFILIPEENLKEGRNEIVVEFTHPYTNDGRGFHRFVDPEDKRIYTYTNLQPFKSNRVFPNFDQADLRATYKMKVKAPKSWKVVTSVRENKIEKQGKDRIWHFPRSERFSTYIWSLHAGDYKVWNWHKGKYPLRLFARQSLAKYVKTEDWFPITDIGFEFFEKYFGVDYPYKKYDQLIVPEFNAGAMENVGAVTFTERYVSRGEKRRDQRRRLANVIYHEMAHMWFGNLVTMKWWNDLWLNESFATYMAGPVGLVRSSEFKEAWHDFMGMKGWAYWEDQLPTTHPIEPEVPNTEKAFAIFDGITYGKGASVLKLLHFQIGDEAFRKGLEYYFKKHAGGNTELKDFIAALEHTSGQDLKSWRNKWLQTASLNTIEVQLSCDAGKVSELKFIQTYPEEYPTLRPHSMEVAFLDKSGELSSKFKAEIDGREKVIDVATGKSCPDMIFPNYNDHGYFKVKLNKETLGNIGQALPKIKDGFLRDLYLRTLWSMVRDGDLSAVAYAKLLLKVFPKEKNFIILRSQARRVVNRLLFYLPKENQEQKEFYESYVKDLEAVVWKRLLRARSGSESQKIWYSVYTSIASSPKAMRHVADLLTGKRKLRGFKLDQDKRWGLLSLLSEFKYKGVDKLIAKEEKRDSSSRGKKMAMVTRAVYPDWARKAEWLTRMTDEKSDLTFDQFRTLARGIFPRSQVELRQKYSNQFFQELLKLEKAKEAHYPEAFSGLAPSECFASSMGKISDFLNDNSDLRPKTVKQLKVRRKESERCRKIKELAIKEGVKATL